MREMTREEKIFFWNFVRESDWIEGLSNNRKELQSQIIMTATEGHMGAMFLARYLADRQLPLNRKAIGRLQEMVCAGQSSRGGKDLNLMERGRYRKTRVFIVERMLGYSCGGVFSFSSKVVQRTPSPKTVPRLMENWLRRVQRWQKNIRHFSQEQAAERIADFHFEFERIHPFVDGNGRTGRLLTYYMLRWAGLRPFIFWEYDKTKDYYPACQDRGLMRQYFLTRIFHPEKILGRIETVTLDDMVDF